MLKTWGFVLFVTLICSFLAQRSPPEFQFAPPPSLQESSTPLLERRALPAPPTKSMHASTLVALCGTHLLGAYFAGSAEGERDVQIYANLYNLDTKKWSPAFKLLSAGELSQLSGVYVKALGNPVLVVQRSRLYLFVVGVSLGGWATSRIYLLSAPLASKYTSSTPIFTWKFEQLLSLSPFLNISYLVRNSAISTTDGGFVLPIYHELATKSPLLLKFNSRARLQEIIQPNTLKAQLQPTLAPYGPCAFLAFRSYKDTRLYTQTCQNPTHWNPPQVSNLPNYNDALTLFNANNTLYLLYNAPLPHSSASRSTLRLAQLLPSASALNHFKFLRILDQSQTGEVSYPCALVLGDKVHVLYTKNRQAIMHLVFNSAYLKTPALSAPEESMPKNSPLTSPSTEG
ncbi:exo-alpha-sialidase [Helicobacter salomonis]|uniref:exo-alpha-sialidase n=1 Tax=Helicobacter salomonis TaxID=56878 RepID=UPI000CF109D4|nr:sialidase family protein [Helicobacter salomonis]